MTAVHNIPKYLKGQFGSLSPEVPPTGSQEAWQLRTTAVRVSHARLAAERTRGILTIPSVSPPCAGAGDAGSAPPHTGPLSRAALISHSDLASIPEATALLLYGKCVPTSSETRWPDHTSWTPRSLCPQPPWVDKSPSSGAAPLVASA